MPSSIPCSLSRRSTRPGPSPEGDGLDIIFSFGPSRHQTLRDAKQLLDLATVKADDHLAIDDRDRSRPQPELQQLLQRLRILPDVLRDELDPLLRKKLFLLVTGASPGLGINDHLLRHDLLLAYLAFGSAKSEPKISRPASKASLSERTTPEGSPLPCRQTAR